MAIQTIRKDESGNLDVGHWAGLIIGAMVLLIIVAALFPTLQDALSDYAAADTTFGPILQTLVPILIGTGILLGFVAVFLKFGKGRK